MADLTNLYNSALNNNINYQGGKSYYTDFEDNIWLEIIKIAAQMYVENQSDPRYKTLTNEVLTQE